MDFDLGNRQKQIRLASRKLAEDEATDSAS
jgi:hypothetical protein